MQTKLIQIQDYLLLIDKEAEIKMGDIVIHNFGMGYELEEPCDKDNLKSNTRFKIIAYYPLTKEAKELDLPLLLNPFEEKEINVLADNYVNNPYFTSNPKTLEEDRIKQSFLREGYIAGYKAAQPKQFSFTKVELESLLLKVIRTPKYFGNNTPQETVERIIQSLSTQQLPKEFIPEYDVSQAFHRSLKGDKIFSIFNLVDDNFKDIGLKNGEMIRNVSITDIFYPLKTITNSEGKQVLVGTYKY